MAAKAKDRLDLLRSKYLNQIQSAEATVKSLRDKLRLLDELDADSKDLDVGTGANGSVAGKGLTEALLAAVEASSDGATGVQATQLKKYILSQGYIPKGKNLTVSVQTSLKRLAKQGQITSELVEGKRLYRAKK